MSKAGEAKEKIEAEAEEGMRVWAEYEAEERVKAEITRISTEASTRANIKAGVRLMERDKTGKRKTEEAGARIRAREEVEKAK